MWTRDVQGIIQSSTTRAQFGFKPSESQAKLTQAVRAGTRQRGDHHREPGSVPRPIARVGVSGAHGVGDHSLSRHLHWQDYEPLHGKTVSNITES